MHRRIAGWARRRHAVLLCALSPLACERAPGPASSAAGSTTPGGDTIVRQVVRVVRTPTMMGRVTGPAPALHALRPLDSVYAVRVMDQRGRDMSGVDVAWAVDSSGAGAALRVANARTDSLGISRAVFTPGSTAMPQTVIATVAGVGAITFRVEIPVASIRVVLDTAIAWANDEVQVLAEVRDAAGGLLTNAPLGWSSADTAVAAVASFDGTRARMRARLAGSADVIAWTNAGRVRGSARLRVRPEIAGSFVALDSAPLPASVEIRAGAVRDSLQVVDARFRGRLELPAYTGVELLAAPATPAHHRVHTRVESPRALQDLRVALVPTRWRITGGAYDQQVIDIDAAGALRRPQGSAAFWRLPPITRSVPPRLIGWAETAFPIRIAFDRRRSIDGIARDDSIAFWRIAAQMEADLGTRLFAPADAPSEDARAGIVTVEIAKDVGAGHTFVTWNESGDAYDGTLMFRSAATLRDAHVVTHELLHLLGFGHATTFPSVSRASGGTAQRLTPEDVAHVQLAMRLRTLQVRTGARPGLPVLSP